MDDAQVGSIAQLTFTLDGDPPMDSCSGVLVGDGAVLTAAHCVHGLPVLATSVAFGGSGGAVAMGATTVAHPTLDLLLVTLQSSATATLPGIPLASREIAPGDLAELAGTGLGGGDGEVRFAVEQVVDTDGQFITVRGDGASGACMGDSGGPLLVRDSDGEVAVAGILSQGSVSCLGSDRYTALTGALDWLAPLVPPLAPSSSCGNLSPAGRCFDGIAVWCEGGSVAATDCTGSATRVCGWDRGTAGWRCIDRANDPCSGVTDLGECAGDVVVRCGAGTLEEEPCDLCAAGCQRSAATGAAQCVGVGDVER
jgi:hypothetical protein